MTKRRAPARRVLNHEPWPRNALHKYGIYARRGRRLHLLATASDPAGIGVALVRLDADYEEAGTRLIDEGAIGVRDRLTGRWLVMPWHRPEPVS